MECRFLEEEIIISIPIFRLVLSQNTLEIFNLQREDYGMYQCFVSRGALEAQAASELRLGGNFF